LSFFWERSSLAFSSVTAPNAPRLPPFISGGAEAGAWVADRHRSRPAAAWSRLEGGDEEEEAEAATRRRGGRIRRGMRIRCADGRVCQRADGTARRWWDTARVAADSMGWSGGGVGGSARRWVGGSKSERRGGLGAPLERRKRAISSFGDWKGFFLFVTRGP